MARLMAACMRSASATPLEVTFSFSMFLRWMRGEPLGRGSSAPAATCAARCNRKCQCGLRR
eukprot:12426943-Prorocentrum_lima.AAC.1